MTKRKIFGLHVMAMAVMSVLYMAPLFAKSGTVYVWRHDLPFQFSRILGLQNILATPVNFNVFAHHGNGINYFYPWLTAYPMNLLYRLTNDIAFASNLFLLMVTFLTMLIAYFSMQKMKHDPRLSLLFALIFAFSLYRTDDLFLRMALGETIAFTFLPLLLLGCYQIFVGNYRRWYYLAIGMTLILYSHVLSAVMGAAFIFLALIVTVIFWKERRRRLFALAYATITTVVLSAGYWVGYIQQVRAQSIKTPPRVNLEGMKPSVMFSGILDNNLIAHTIGLTIAIVAVVAIVKWRDLNAADRLILGLGVFSVFVTMSFVPWGIFDGSAVTQVQFVWRLNMYGTLFLAYAGSVALLPMLTRFRPSFATGMALLSVLLVFLNFSAIFSAVRYQAETTQVQVIPAVEVEGIARDRFASDYASRKSHPHGKEISLNTFTLGGKAIQPAWSTTDSTYTVVLDNDGSVALPLSTPIYRYVGVLVTVNGVESPSTVSEIGTLQVDVPTGHSVVNVTYRYTNQAIAGWVVSGLGLLALVPFIFWQRRPGDTGS